MAVSESSESSYSSEELFKRNFALVDSDGDGLLSREEVVLLFRGLGQTPTDEKMKRATAKLPDKTDYAGFKDFFASNYAAPLTESEVLRAFTFFDAGKTGHISTTKFRELLTGVGAGCLTHAEVDEILKRAPGHINNGSIDYHNFAKLLTSGPAANLDDAIRDAQQK